MWLLLGASFHLRRYFHTFVGIKEVVNATGASYFCEIRFVNAHQVGARIGRRPVANGGSDPRKIVCAPKNLFQT